MLLSKHHFQILSHCAWVIRRTERNVYYIKYAFMDNDEYLFLVTDLCLVWFEHGNHERIQHNVKEQLGMSCKDRAASMLMYRKIKAYFDKGVIDCRLHVEPGHLKLFLPLEKPTGDIAALTWVFNCRVLDAETSEEGMTGPGVIFQYFILPSQAIVNYFTENLLDDLPEKLRTPKKGSRFSHDSLEYFNSLQKRELNGVPVLQQQQDPTMMGDSLESQREKEREQEKERDRKRELEEYYNKQRNNTPKKKRI